MVIKMPEPPLIAAGAFGGPSVIYLVTPLRNALTLGSLDASKSALTLYRDVFHGGFGAGYAGGQYMARAALPGFIMLGPVFHVYKDLCGGSSAAAVALTSVSESIVFYGSEAKNAQIAYNQNATKIGAPQIVKMQNQFNPFGAGIGFHVARNGLAMSGLRVFSQPCQDVLAKVKPDMNATSRSILGDFIANVFVSALSTPLHQLFGFVVTHRTAQGSAATGSLMEASKAFLSTQYFTSAGRISSVAGRDIFLRVAYNASIFTMFGMIERTFVSYWPKALNYS